MRSIARVGRAGAVLLALLLAPAGAFAQDAGAGGKSYSYESIAATVTVNPDSTLSVEERQIFRYTGAFHKGWRSIPLGKIDALTDVVVLDGATGQPLAYSRKSLDKLDPESWGKYTTYLESGNQIIEWYYDLADTVHEWVLRYTVHGALGFYDDAIGLSWNIFTSYEVPVETVRAVVKIPDGAGAKILSSGASRSFPENGPISTSPGGARAALFEASAFAPNEAFTVGITFPKELVSQSAYWMDFARLFYGYIGSLIVVLAAFIAGFLFWFFGEHRKQGRGTIVPQYEPPENLRPAMAEVITKERLTDRALAATIIDLAVRGYVTIEEDEEGKTLRSFFRQFFLLGGKARSVKTASRVLQWVLVAVVVFFIISDLLASKFGGAPIWYGAVGIVLAIGAVVGKQARTVDYRIRKAKEFRNDPGLEEYEREYLAALFAAGSHGSFSTYAMRTSADSWEQRAFHQRIVELKQHIIAETEGDTNAYEVTLSTERKWIWWFMLIVVVSFFLGSFIAEFFGQWQLLIAVAALSVLGLAWFLKYEARLSERGRILKEEWLGFKMYLETAERDRLQRLAPDLFEKYLPYAMIFGIEKKWSKAFEGMHLPPPQWYGAMGGAAVGASSVGSFSPVGFSTSFSTAFQSSFGSAGGSGGGGGGAGGGGGGGGGGAS